MNFIYRLLTLAIAVTPFVLSAEVAAPKITGLHALYSRMSDNGKWAVSEKGSEVDGTIEPAGGYLLNLETMENRDLSPADGFAGVSDVTDDGQIVVGSFQTRRRLDSAPDSPRLPGRLPLGCYSRRKICCRLCCAHSEQRICASCYLLRPYQTRLS